MPRLRCSSCDFLLDECLCAEVQPVQCDRHWLVLQHPKEQSHPKNTLRLLTLCVANLKIVCAESGPDIERAISGLKPGSVLLYPSAGVPDWSAKSEALAADASVVLIDATWRKAIKMLALNPALEAMPRRALPHGFVSRYSRRKTSVKGGLSTLEALAYAREIDEGRDPGPLLRLLDARMAIMSRHLPDP